MTQLGVFRDDYYNPVNVLTVAQVTAITQTSGVITGAALASATENYVFSSGAATAMTTDTAANIVASLQNCIIAQLKAQLANGSAGSPPAGVPNLNNLTFIITIGNTGGSTLTLSAGAGVTLVGTATIATGNERTWVATVTGPNAVTLTTIGIDTYTP